MIMRHDVVEKVNDNPEFNKDVPDSFGAGFCTDHKIQSIRKRLKEGDRITEEAWTQLLEYAEKSLEVEPKAVADFNVPGYYRDDEGHNRMKNLLSRQSMAAYSTALAWRIGWELKEDERDAYLRHAMALLNEWSGVNKTASGNDGELVMCYNGTAFIFAAELIDGAAQWKSDHRTRFSEWVETVFREAAGIKNKNNNWACWGILAAVSADVYLGDKKSFKDNVERLKKIIGKQIEPDGRMPAEINRGSRGVWYTYFALAPLTAAMETVRNAGGPDLFYYGPESGGSVKDAVEFFYENALKDIFKWPDSSVKERFRPRRSGRNGALMYAMGIIYGRPEWREYAEHPIWRDRTGLAWINPSLLRPEASAVKD
ncbi:MAG: alginate lyase family protein [Candidatus Brocadiia bacterium]